jgi:predicted nucleotidyltransferase
MSALVGYQALWTRRSRALHDRDSDQKNQREHRRKRSNAHTTPPPCAAEIEKALIDLCREFVNLPKLLADRVPALVARHPEVRGIRLAGSRATGHARPDSDWDFLVEARDFGAVAAALPELVAPLEPLAAQWDRLSEEQCWMLILRGPVKVDLIFPEEPHIHERPWVPSAENLAAIDAHLWDWLLWLRSKPDELVATELEKLFVHLLRPLGVERVPSSVADAVELYRPARDTAAERFGCVVSPALEAEVARALRAES